MNYLCKLAVLLVLSCALLSFSCGGKGGGTDEEPTASISDPDVDYSFTGSLFINDTSRPALGYSLFLLNHTRNVYTQIFIEASGSFKIPVSLFRRFEQYTLHIIDDNNKYIAEVTVDDADNFEFIGGIGIDLGVLVVARDSFGVVDTDSSQVNLTPTDVLAAGSGSLNFDDFEPIDTFSYIKFGANLVINDRNDLLNAFYRSASNPNLYKQGILRWSGARISADFQDSTNKTMLGGLVSSGSKVMLGSRILKNQNTPPQSQPTFASLNYNLTTYDNKLDTTLYPQEIMRPDEFLTFDVIYFTGLDQNDTVGFNFLGKIGRTISMPPLITGMNQGSSSTISIDYNSLVVDNGLTQAFCRTSGDVYLEMDPPESFEPEAFTYDDFNKATIHFEYYYDLNGVSTLADLETNRDGDPLITSDYPNGFNSGFSNSTFASATRVWDPHTQTLDFNFTGTGDILSHDLQIYSNIFLSTINSLNGATVSETKLIITYDGPKHRTGIITSFRPCI